MKKGISRLLSLVLSFAMIMTGFTFLGGAVSVNADDSDKPTFVIICFDNESYGEDVNPQFQPAAGGVYKWLAMDGNWDTLCGKVTADDFKLQTKAVTENEWKDSAAGTIATENLEEEGFIRITADIPDNTGDVDLDWRVVYKYTDPDSQTESCGSNVFTQIKPDVQPEKPGFVIISRDSDSYDTDDIEYQPAAGGKYIWIASDGSYAAALDGAVTADDFKLQTKTQAATEWEDATVGSIALEGVDNWDVRITATIPDNTDSYDKLWRVAYKHSDISTQYESCASVQYVQEAAEEQPAVLPAIADVTIDTASGSAEGQPDKNGVFAWFVIGNLDADFSEVTSDSFRMQVRTNGGEWTDSDAAVKFELGDNDDEGVVTATVPDNTEEIVKQWRFVYAGECVEVPVIHQAGKAAAPETHVIGQVIIDSGNEQPAAGGTYRWAFVGTDTDEALSDFASADFGMEVKSGDGEWTKSDVAVSVDEYKGDQGYLGTVTAAVPDNEEETAKQWRFTYKGGIVDWADEPTDCPAITQAAKEAVPEDTAVAEVVEKINALPEADAVTADNKAAIEEARAAYDALTDGQKEKVDADTLKKLTDAEDALKAIEEAGSADAVKEMINALPAADKVTTADKEKIEEARKAYDALTDEQKADIDDETLAKLTEAEKALAEAQKAEEKAAGEKAAADAQKAAEEKAKATTSVTVNARTVNAKAVNDAIAAAGGKTEYVTEIVIGKGVKKISKKAFKGTEVNTLIVKSKKLTKKSVKGSLKGSKVKTVKVKIGKKKINKKYVKKYKKILTKKNAGKKAKVK